MSVAAVIESKLTQGLRPDTLEVVNESHGHNVAPGSETHFKVVAVSDQFDSLRPVQRHQKVYGLLAEELVGGVHALALHLYTPAEWRARDAAPESPDCMGGAKR